MQLFWWKKFLSYVLNVLYVKSATGRKKQDEKKRQKKKERKNNFPILFTRTLFLFVHLLNCIFIYLYSHLLYDVILGVLPIYNVIVSCCFSSLIHLLYDRLQLLDLQNQKKNQKKTKTTQEQFFFVLYFLFSSLIFLKYFSLFSLNTYSFISFSSFDLDPLGVHTPRAMILYQLIDSFLDQLNINLLYISIHREVFVWMILHTCTTY